MAEPAANQAIDVGTILAGTYEVTRLVGKGGMGAVWQARHLRLEAKKVAIKVLHAEVASDAESVARFRREAQIASRLGHPNIVQVHDFNELPDGTQYLVLEFLEGESLADRLRHGPLPLDHALAILRQVSSALHAAHAEHIVHRDLKPHNIFLCPTESSGYATEQAKVLDFGISKIRGSQTVRTQAATLLGTPQYMAPEQAMGDHAAVDQRTDIFALGAIVYEMLSGRPPFMGTTIPEVVFKVVYEEPPRLDTLVPALDPALVAAVHRALAKKQDDRFADVSAFVEALTGDPLITLRGGQVITALPGKPLPLSPSVASSRARARSDEAFAATVPPGVSASAPTSAMASTVARPGAHTTTNMRGQAAGPINMSQGAATEPMSPVQTENARGEAHQPAQPRRSTGLFMGLGALAVVAAVAVTVLIMKKSSTEPAEVRSAAVVAGTPSASSGKHEVRGDDPAQPAGNPTQPAGQEPAPGKQDATTDPGARDPASSTTQAAQQDRSATEDKPEPRLRPKDEPKDEAGPDPETDDEPGEPAAQPLEELRALLDSGDFDEVIRLARQRLGDKRPGAAYATLVMGYCGKHDFGNAKANFVHVKNPRLRKRVKAFCARNDVELD